MNFIISVHLKSGHIREVAFGGSRLKKEMVSLEGDNVVVGLGLGIWCLTPLSTIY